MAPKKRTPARATGQTQISISLPVELLSRIEAAAQADHRNRSNWLVALATRALEGKAQP